MNAWYNEIDPFAAQWIENLAAAGHVAAGTVERRSVIALEAADVPRDRQCHFFAGIGGWSRALRLAGWPDDLLVWTASCPCQPFSNNGNRKRDGRGFDDERHLWPVYFDRVEEHRPPVMFGEQVASPDGLAWLDLVSADLEGAGYTVGAADLCAAGAGAPHGRQRLYWVAYTDDEGFRRVKESYKQATLGIEASRRRDPDGRGRAPWTGAIPVEGADGTRRLLQPGIEPVAHGVPRAVGPLRAYGNAIVPEIAASFIEAVME